MIGDFEGGCEREIGWEEQGFAIAVGVQVGGLVWSAGGDKDVECGRCVLQNVDREIQRVCYSTLYR